VADPAAPPPGWSPTAKSEFATLPQTVREAIAQREVEINQGFAKLQDYKGLDPFIDMAKEAGTNIETAMNNYVNAEKLLENDPVRGIQYFMETYGVTPSMLAGPQQQMQQPQQQQQMQPGQEQQYQQPQVDLSPLTNEINSLRQMVEGNNQERVAERTAQTTAEINTFFSDTANNPYAENVADQMAALIKSGVAPDLQSAYEQACWNNPEIRNLLIKKQTDETASTQAAEAKRKADQARTAGASISGVADESTVGGAPPDNLRAHLEQQFAGGRV